MHFQRAAKQHRYTIGRTNNKKNIQSIRARIRNMINRAILKKENKADECGN